MSERPGRRRETEGWGDPRRALLRPAHAARAVAVVGLVVVIGIGCFLDRSGRAPAEATFTCTATLRSPSGAMDMADNSMGPWAGTVCVPFEASPEDEWRRHLFEVASSDPAVSALGFSCAEAVTCGTRTGLPEGMSCPPARSATPIPVCGESGTRCLDIQPPTTDAGFDARVDFPTGTVGVRSAPATATVTNICADPVRLFVDEALAGRDAGFFGIAANACGPRDDEERAIGRSLTGSESCTIDFYFEPTAVMSFASANLGLTQDTVEVYRIRLFGEGISP